MATVILVVPGSVLIVTRTTNLPDGFTKDPFHNLQVGGKKWYFKALYYKYRFILIEGIGLHVHSMYKPHMSQHLSQKVSLITGISISCI